ncbi:ORF6N domain-containing protein [Sphingobacterium griseoflavum]|uniref:ORF6N domain-containing protein n=1 Tax=Sphingobacterium griseoflavum TaxID=1474952 RepID=UPI00167839AC|nr:ORF6N domain-containing protein [Sphingobacterium griseoflavum]
MLRRSLFAGAGLYGVETRVLKQAVRRNIERFPEDFMFEMTTQAFAASRSQSVILKDNKKGLRYAPFCFAEQGAAMLSSVLKSKLAISINIQVMRIFRCMRQLPMDNVEITKGDSPNQKRETRTCRCYYQTASSR